METRCLREPSAANSEFLQFSEATLRETEKMKKKMKNNEKQ